jgi:hypothetical protein
MFGKKAPVNNLLDEKVADGMSAAPRPEDKIIQEISVHKMPKDYKAGSFSYDEYFNSAKPGANTIKVSETSAPKSTTNSVSTPVTPSAPNVVAPKSNTEKAKAKNMGMMIIGGVVILVLVAAYFLVTYLMGGQKTVKPVANNNISVTPHVVKNTAPSTTEPVMIPTSTVATSTEITTSTIPVVATTTPSSTPVITGQALFDSDMDGLNDQEEAVLGTDPNKADTDGDGYNDLAELSKLYNPSGKGTIDQDVNIAKFTNSTYKYKIDYPKVWTTQSVNNNASEIFTDADNSFVQVVVQSNDQKQNIKDWYNTEFSQVVSADQMIKVAGVDAVSSLDGLNIYFTDAAKKNVYVISYAPIDDTKPAYREIFQMMIATFAF